MAGDNRPVPDPIYIAMDGVVVTGPIKTSLVDVAITLLAVYYTFAVQYTSFYNVYPFFEYFLLGNTCPIKHKVVATKQLNLIKP